MRLGFIGTGHITAAVVTGLCTSDRAPARVLLSPRNAAKAAGLAAAFPQVEVADHNQGVVEGSDTVVLAVRPQDARAVIGPLVFRADQKVVSLLALTPLAVARELAAPAEQVARALPLPPCARHLGPVVVYPGEPGAVALFEPIGTVLSAASEREFDVLWSLTALIAPYFALIAETAGWASKSGVAAPTAGGYVASMFHGLSVLALEARDGDVSGLVQQAQTPGGLNEQALAEIRAGGGYQAVLGALDSILARLDEAARKGAA